MKLQDLIPFFPHAEEAVEYVNAMVVAEHEFFRKKRRLFDNDERDYRQQALDRVTSLKLPFTSTDNSAYLMMTTFVKVVCPYCGTETHGKSGSGNGQIQSVQYKCTDCGAVISLSIPPDGFHAEKPTL